MVEIDEIRLDEWVDIYEHLDDDFYLSETGIAHLNNMKNDIKKVINSKTQANPKKGGRMTQTNKAKENIVWHNGSDKIIAEGLLAEQQKYYEHQQVCLLQREQKQHEEEMLESAKINIGLIKKCQDLKKKVEQFERKVK